MLREVLYLANRCCCRQWNQLCWIKIFWHFIPAKDTSLTINPTGQTFVAPVALLCQVEVLLYSVLGGSPSQAFPSSFEKRLVYCLECPYRRMLKGLFRHTFFFVLFLSLNASPLVHWSFCPSIIVSHLPAVERMLIPSRDSNHNGSIAVMYILIPLEKVWTYTLSSCVQWVVYNG